MKNHIRHMALMLAVCAAVWGLNFIHPKLGITLGPAGSTFLLLLCPLLHIFLMKGMFSKKGCNNKKVETAKLECIEEKDM